MAFNGLLASNVTAKEGGEVGNPVYAFDGMKCQVKNTYMLRSHDKILASYTEEDGQMWPESSDSNTRFEKTYKVRMKHLLESVHDTIDGLSSEETMEVLIAAVKEGKDYPTEVIINPPVKGFFGIGKKGDWETSKVMASIKTGGNFSSGTASENTLSETKAIFEVPSFQGDVRKEVAQKIRGEWPELLMTNEASFKCSALKDEIIEHKKGVNNTSRTNLKGSTPAEEKSTKATATSQK